MIGRVVSPVFVGRGAELATLAEAQRLASTVGPAVVLVAGEPGIGKSRLVAEFVDRQRPDVRVLAGGCPELGSWAARATDRLIVRWASQRSMTAGSSTIKWT